MLTYYSWTLLYISNLPPPIWIFPLKMTVASVCFLQDSMINNLPIVGLFNPSSAFSLLPLNPLPLLILPLLNLQNT